MQARQFLKSSLGKEVFSFTGKLKAGGRYDFVFINPNFLKIVLNFIPAAGARKGNGKTRLGGIGQDLLAS